MESVAKTNHIRISPRKVALVLDEIRGYELIEALDLLKYTNKRAANIIYKTLQSAYANARVLNPEIKKENLFVKKIFVGKGVTWKRFRPRARGRASKILRRTSKLTVVLSDE